MAILLLYGLICIAVTIASLWLMYDIDSIIIKIITLMVSVVSITSFLMAINIMLTHPL